MWIVLIVTLISVVALVLRLPIEFPWPCFLILSFMFIVVNFDRNRKERFVVQRSDLVTDAMNNTTTIQNAFQKMTLLPQYAVEGVGSGLDSLIAALKKGNEFTTTVPKKRSTLDETQFMCPNAKEPLCRGRFLDKIAFAELKSQLVDVRDFFEYFTSGSAIPGRAEMLDKLVLGTI
jgi:hypothetical protein